MITISPVELELVLDSRVAGVVVFLAGVVSACPPCVSSLKELPSPSEDAARAGGATAPSASASAAAHAPAARAPRAMHSRRRLSAATRRGYRRRAGAGRP